MIKHAVLLASASPRRAYLLKQGDIDYRIVKPTVDEVIDPNLSPFDVPCDIAMQKANSLIEELKAGEILLAADTIVLFEDEIIGKPAGKKAARKILTKMSGKEHKVITGVVLMTKEHTEQFSSVTSVVFNELLEREIDYYIKHYKPIDKAGAYGIQEWIGHCKVKSINGSYSNIMGLPMELVYEALRRFPV